MIFALTLAMAFKLQDFFNHYTGAPHQLAAIQQLQEDLPDDLKTREATWFETWRAGGKVLWVPVPYFHQLDLKEGHRKCFTAAIAMLAADYGRVDTAEQYDNLRAKYGDTTDVSAHLKALDELGLHAEFVQNATPELLEAELDPGRAVAVGWLHRGDVSVGQKPAGNGHWSVIIGYTKTMFIAKDPRGKADLVHGGHENHYEGEDTYYPRKQWLPRWEVEGPGTGWAVLVDDNPSRISYTK